MQIIQRILSNFIIIFWRKCIFLQMFKPVEKALLTVGVQAKPSPPLRLTCACQFLAGPGALMLFPDSSSTGGWCLSPVDWCAKIPRFSLDSTCNPPGGQSLHPFPLISPPIHRATERPDSTPRLRAWFSGFVWQIEYLLVGKS